MVTPDWLVCGMRDIRKLVVSKKANKFNVIPSSASWFRVKNAIFLLGK